jgi:hypothetical protein
MKIKLDSLDDREQVIANNENKGFVLIEEQNHTDGNYLIFLEKEKLELQELELKIQNEIRELAINSLKTKGEITEKQAEELRTDE